MVKMLLTLARCLLFEITCYRPQLENEHFYQDFGSLMPSLSLTLNVEPCERLYNIKEEELWSKKSYSC